MVVPSSLLGWLFAASHAGRTSDPIRLINELEAQRDEMRRRAAELDSNALAGAAEHIDRLVTVLKLYRTVTE
jgi:hypothetical protein